MVHAENAPRQGHRHRDERGLHRNRHRRHLGQFGHRGIGHPESVHHIHRVICFRRVICTLSEQCPVIVNLVRADSCGRKRDFKCRGQYITSGVVNRVFRFKRLFNRQCPASINFVHPDSCERKHDFKRGDQYITSGYVNRVFRFKWLFNKQRSVVVNLSCSNDRKQEHAVASRHHVGTR